uniref:Uncharacterized protein n=1 Tax=Nelumbo nucifera TaxID=4432 RepID=A0A822XMN5_NELNU|nr:TPA_asm: hypothetical protein HUJ06_023000 [Nelumbo nucifera]
MLVDNVAPCHLCTQMVVSVLIIFLLKTITNLHVMAHYGINY